MKIRNSFVTNSSSSSFIISNKTDKEITSEDVARALFEKIIESSKGELFTVPPNESITVECSDDIDDTLISQFIHGVYMGYGYIEHLFKNDIVEIDLKESHH